MKTIINDHSYKWLRVIYIILFIFIQHAQLMISFNFKILNSFRIFVGYTILDMIILAILSLVVIVITKNIQKSIFYSNLIVTLISSITFYVILFHGSPILAGDLLTTTTALNVLSEYKLVMHGVIKLIVCVFLMECLLQFSCYHVIKWVNKQKDFSNVREVNRRNVVILLLIDMISIYALLLSPVTVFSKNLCSWSWQTGIEKYGYEICLLNSFYTIKNTYDKPENYRKNIIKVVNEEKTKEYIRNPDIILILNETLFDLNVYTDIVESKELFDTFYHNNNLICGNSVVSMSGGGTNNSEFELLTSNSMKLLNLSAPFTFLNMNNIPSIVTAVNSYNYSTTAMHCGAKSNYSRNRAYTDMGFEHILLGEDAFDYYNENGNRPWLDKDNYKDMIEEYEKNSGNPQLIYCLTIQNHGGYEQNDGALDTISINEDFGNITPQINEYLSSVQLSIEAFIELTKYYDSINRDVLILMVGDHASSFINNLPPREELNKDEQEIAMRSVPYVIWSNFDLDIDYFKNEYVTMTDLLPLVKAAAGMQLTNYDRIICDLSQRVPVRTSYGIYMDEKRNIGKITSDCPYYELIQNYYYAEYELLENGLDASFLKMK